jgi:serine phosphatase RsbU (regulator of sigma subunit)
MGTRRVLVGRHLEQRSGSRLVAIPIMLILVIAVTDVLSPPDVHLGPLLVVAPTITASFAGPRLVALTGVLAVIALLVTDVFNHELALVNSQAQLVALVAVSSLVVFYSLARERRERKLSQVRSVSETAQRALLQPPPHRIGPLRVAWLYLAAEDETQIGGDLFAVARAAHPSTRAIIGDVRGKGLASIGEASMVLGTFRENAHRYATLPELAADLEESVCRNLEAVADIEHDKGEHFITAVVLDVPDDDPQAEMINFGHPPPLLVHSHQVTVLHSRRPAPPLGICELPVASHRTDPFTFEAGDMLLLYTDGVIEARSPTGAFYPLAERVASFPASSPDALLHHIRRDLLAHIGGSLADDAALMVIERTSSHHLRHRTWRPHPQSVTDPHQRIGPAH